MSVFKPLLPIINLTWQFKLKLTIQRLNIQQRQKSNIKPKRASNASSHTILRVKSDSKDCKLILVFSVAPV